MAPKRLLIVDDDEQITSHLSLQLSAHFDISVAHNGQEAIEWLDKNPGPTAVLLDIRMPVMNGFEFLDATRMRYPTLGPIIVLSATPPALLHDRRVTAILNKPIVVSDLMEVMIWTSALTTDVQD